MLLTVLCTNDLTQKINSLERTGQGIAKKLKTICGGYKSECDQAYLQICWLTVEAILEVVCSVSQLEKNRLNKILIKFANWNLRWFRFDSFLKSKLGVPFWQFSNLRIVFLSKNHLLLLLCRNFLNFNSIRKSSVLFFPLCRIWMWNEWMRERKKEEKNQQQ